MPMRKTRCFVCKFEYSGDETKHGDSCDNCVLGKLEGWEERITREAREKEDELVENQARAFKANRPNRRDAGEFDTIPWHLL